MASSMETPHGHLRVVSYNCLSLVPEERPEEVMGGLLIFKIARVENVEIRISGIPNC